MCLFANCSSPDACYQSSPFCSPLYSEALSIRGLVRFSITQSDFPFHPTCDSSVQVVTVTSDFISNPLCTRKSQKTSRTPGRMINVTNPYFHFMSDVIFLLRRTVNDNVNVNIKTRRKSYRKEEVNFSWGRKKVVNKMLPSVGQ